MIKTLFLISFAALAGATTAAHAVNCPRGQIYRVSKHACMDRSEAVKLGIVHGSAHDTEKGASAPAADAAPDATSAPEAAPEAEAKPAPPAKPPRAARIAPPKHPKQPASEPEAAIAQDPPQNPPAATPVKTEAQQPENKPNPFGVLDPNNVPAMARGR